MRWVVLYSSLFICMFISSESVVYAEGVGDYRTGILSGVLEKVESTVTETTESVGDVVGSAVEGTDQTVRDAVTFTKGTVETLVDPSTKQPVSEIVNHTIEFVEETVDNVVPVVEDATETVQTVTSGVTGIVEELPEVPVATPVFDEVGKVVNKTTETMNDTFEVAEVEETADSLGKVTENETPVLPQVVDTPSRDSQTDKVSEQPVIDTRQEVENDDQVSEIDFPENAESTVQIVVEETTFISNEDPLQTVAGPVKQVVNVAKIKKETPAKQETPAVPIQSSTQRDGIPIAITTGNTSVVSPVVAHNGNADFVTGIVDGFSMLRYLSSRQWVHSDEFMRIQWVHAPPGQPPQTNPFLQEIK
ncbi:hypothetical protein [Sporosarcina luteola]|uniref:hypothetical protein n=1 Tax=Sporosarcina luteola TaxID=582850 RepID=UPI00203CB898|nr:hypothetical protein [Sporosarcina luteola]MCM3709068.1 hypothetical protein [Sporosarcina luteola]